MGRFVHLIR